MVSDVGGVGGGVSAARDAVATASVVAIVGVVVPWRMETTTTTRVVVVRSTEEQLCRPQIVGDVVVVVVRT